MNMPWGMDQYPREETKERGGVDWVLRRGLAIGTKMLVAGIVIGSVPVVLPPILIASALGFTISVPYGMILASYTCSEKLLSKFLPGTHPRDSLEEDDYAFAYKEVEEDYDEFRGALDVEEEREKRTDELNEVLNVRTKEPRGEVIQELVLTPEAIAPDLCETEKVEASVTIAGDIRPKDLVPMNYEKMDSGIPGQMEAASESKSNGNKSRKKGRKKERVDVKKLPNSSDENMIEIESGVAQTVMAGADAEEDRPNHAKDDKKIKTSKRVAVQSLLGVTQPKDETDSVRKAFILSPDKGMYSEEGIWQKIDAIRRIVGYKASREASCMEELKALYLFTGVELPDSFKGASYLEEVNEKLHFLLSVVGVE